MFIASCDSEPTTILSNPFGGAEASGLESGQALGEVLVQIEAEDGTLNGVSVQSKHTNHSGTGYVDYQSASGESITWQFRATISTKLRKTVTTVTPMQQEATKFLPVAIPQ